MVLPSIFQFFTKNESKKANRSRNKIRILNFEDCLLDASILIKTFDKNSSKNESEVLTKLHNLYNSDTFWREIHTDEQCEWAFSSISYRKWTLFYNIIKDNLSIKKPSDDIE